MEIISSNKEGKKLLYEGFAYVVNRRKEGIIYRRCEKQASCSASIIACNKLIEKNSENHSHPADEARISALKVIENMKDRSLKSDKAPSSVINHCTSDLPLSICGALPVKDSLARSIRHARVRASENEDLTVTTRGDQFLLYESESVCIYTTRRNLKVLKSINKWVSDGTFNCAPGGKQLYTIHCVVAASKTLPLLCCVTSNKDEKTYNVIFEFLKEQSLNSKSVTVNFEQATIKSLRKRFPNTSISGCFFHFSQCLW